jgi:hypothetical protein
MSDQKLRTDYKISIRQLRDVLETAEFDTEVYGEQAKVGFDNAIIRMQLYLQQEWLKVRDEEFKRQKISYSKEEKEG